MDLFLLLSPLHPAHRFDPVFVTLASAMGLAGICYALRMIFRPKNHLEVLERRLHRLEYQSLSTQHERAARKIVALRLLIYSDSPTRKIRIQAYLIILVIIIFEIGVWYEQLSNLPGR